MIKLKPCPFCGEVENLSNEGHYVECSNCGATGPNKFPVPDQKLTDSLWNTRKERP